MKNEMITYRSDEKEQVLIDASQKALESLGMYNGNSNVSTSYELLTALSDAVKRSNLVLVLITKSEYIKIKKIISKSLGIELVKNSTVAKRLGRLSADKEFQLHDNFPKGSVVLESKDALYSGYYLKSGSQSIVFSPLDVARTEGILEKAGIRLEIECVDKHKLRFVGVTKAKLENSIKEIGGVKNCTVNDLGGELEATVETADSTEELAKEKSRILITQLKRIYKSKLYGVDCYPLVSLTVTVLEKEHNQLAIADTESSTSIVSYLAVDSRAGEWCKKIRLSSTCSKAGSQEEVSELARKVRNKSGFELAIVLGDKFFDEGKTKDCAYGALANERGVLTKRFWKYSGETDVDFRTRCAKELVLLLYNDRIGDEEYGTAKNGFGRINPRKGQKLFAKPHSEPEGDKMEEQTDGVERANCIAPEANKAKTRVFVIVVLALVIVALTAALLLNRGDGGDDEATTTTTTTTSISTTATTTSEQD